MYIYTTAPTNEPHGKKNITSDRSQTLRPPLTASENRSLRHTAAHHHGGTGKIAHHPAVPEVGYGHVTTSAALKPPVILKYA